MQSRPLLVIPAASQPSRRFLRAMVRCSPEEARKFVAVTGDSISFNIVYRDRHFAWPIQDLPFSLVFFAHRDPVDPSAGFPLDRADRMSELEVDAARLAGTDDLLLYRDIVAALLGSGNPTPGDGENLACRLRLAMWNGSEVGYFEPGKGKLLFDDNGNRRSRSGEHLVVLRPRVHRRMVQPFAILEIWSQGGGELANWKIRARLPVTYEGYLEGDDLSF